MYKTITNHYPELPTQAELFKVLLENAYIELKKDSNCNNFRIDIDNFKVNSNLYDLLVKSFLEISQSLTVVTYKHPTITKYPYCFNSEPVFNFFRFDGLFNYGFGDSFLSKIKNENIEVLLNEVYPSDLIEEPIKVIKKNKK